MNRGYSPLDDEDEAEAGNDAGGGGMAAAEVSAAELAKELRVTTELCDPLTTFHLLSTSYVLTPVLLDTYFLTTS